MIGLRWPRVGRAPGYFAQTSTAFFVLASAIAGERRPGVLGEEIGAARVMTRKNSPRLGLAPWTEQMQAEFGGARRNRTDDLFNGIEALSQLSYGPIFSSGLWEGDRIAARCAGV
jgi:hypothetical protein